MKEPSCLNRRPCDSQRSLYVPWQLRSSLGTLVRLCCRLVHEGCGQEASGTRRKAWGLTARVMCGLPRLLAAVMP